MFVQKNNSVAHLQLLYSIIPTIYVMMFPCFGKPASRVNLTVSLQYFYFLELAKCIHIRWMRLMTQKVKVSWRSKGVSETRVPSISNVYMLESSRVTCGVSPFSLGHYVLGKYLLIHSVLVFTGIHLTKCVRIPVHRAVHLWTLYASLHLQRNSQW